MASSPRDDYGDDDPTRVDRPFDDEIDIEVTPDIDPTALPGYAIGFTAARRLYHRHVSPPPLEPQTDSTAGRSRTVSTARELRHRIRNDIHLVIVSAALLEMPTFHRDGEALDAIRTAADRLLADSDALYNLATGSRPRWLRWLFG